MVYLKILKYLALIVVALILQSTVANVCAIAQISPDLLLILLVYVSLQEGAIGGTVFGFFLGLMADLYAPLHLGLNALCKSVIGFSVGNWGPRMYLEGVASKGGVFLLITLGHDLLYQLVKSAGGLGDVTHRLLRYTVPTAVYTALIGTAIFVLIEKRRKRGHLTDVGSASLE